MASLTAFTIAVIARLSRKDMRNQSRAAVRAKIQLGHTAQYTLTGILCLTK